MLDGGTLIAAPVPVLSSPVLQPAQFLFAPIPRGGVFTGVPLPAPRECVARNQKKEDRKRRRRGHWRRHASMLVERDGGGGGDQPHGHDQHSLWTCLISHHNRVFSATLCAQISRTARESLH